MRDDPAAKVPTAWPDDEPSRNRRVPATRRRPARRRLTGLVLSLWAACAPPPDEASPADVASQSFVSATASELGRYAVLATRAVRLGDRAVVAGQVGVAPGAPGAPGLLIAGFAARVAVGSVLVAERVVLHHRVVAGDIRADRIEARNATVGSTSPFVPPPAAPTPAAVIASGGAAVVVGPGRSRTLAPGRHGAVIVDGHLQLSGGLYEIRSLRMGAGARVTALSATTLRIADGVTADDRARVAPASGKADDLRLIAAGVTRWGGDESVRFSADGRLVALVVAKAAFRTGPRFVGSGSIAAAEIAIGDDGRFSWDGGFGCAAPAACDPSGACTTAACTDARCLRQPAPDGTACDDGDVCTRADACRAGACSAGVPMVTERSAGGSSPTGLAVTDDGDVWFVLPESSPGAADGSVQRISHASDQITSYPAHRRLLDLAPGRDGGVWLAERLAADEDGLWAIGHLLPSGVFADEFVGIPVDRLAIGAAGDVWFAATLPDEGGTGGARTIAGSLRTSDGLITALLFLRNAARAMTMGPDGNVWIAESSAGSSPAWIARVQPDGTATEFEVPTAGDLNAITSGPDGNLWFTDEGENEVGRITPSGDVTKFPLPTAASGVTGIVAAPDGNLWFTERTANKLGRITPAGVVTELACIPTAGAAPTAMAADRAGRLWFTESAVGRVASLRVP